MTPTASFSDEPLRIVATGLRPHGRGTVTVTSVDAAGVHWSGFARVRVDAAGAAVVPLTALLEMRPASASLASSYAWSATEADSFLVSIAAGPVRVTRAFTRRQLEQPVDEVAATLRGEGFVGRLYSPAATPGRHPAVLLLGGSEGGLPPYLLGIARQLAAHGVDALAVAYWAYPGLPGALRRIPLEYFAGALRWLDARPGVDPARTAVEGISYGSEAALLLGAHYPQLVHRVVASVPSNLATECYGGTCNGTDPAWTFAGRGIGPFSPIPVERIDGPILAICGTRDLVWPSCPQAGRILARRRAHHVRFRDTLLAERNAGHLVGATVPYEIYPFDLTYTQRATDEAGAERVWPRLVAFLGGGR